MIDLSKFKVGDIISVVFKRDFFVNGRYDCPCGRVERNAGYGLEIYNFHLGYRQLALECDDIRYVANPNDVIKEMINEAKV